MAMSISTNPHRGRIHWPASSPASGTASGTAEFGGPNVVALNESAALFMALAAEIRGTAVGLSPAGLALLRHGLEIRFGHLLNNTDDSVFDQLVQLASTPAA